MLFFLLQTVAALLHKSKYLGYNRKTSTRVAASEQNGPCFKLPIAELWRNSIETIRENDHQAYFMWGERE